MPFIRPTLGELITRSRNDLEARLDGVQPVLRRAFVRVLATVFAGAQHLMYGFLNWLSLQLFAETAEEEYLLRMGRRIGVDQKAASYAAGTVTITGADGNTLIAGKTLRRDDGAEYTVDSDATIAGGTATVTVTASDAGDAGNADAGTKLTITETIPGINGEATVDVDGLSGGHDIESIDDYRERYLARRRAQPQGGANIDFELWAKEVAGVTRAWVYPREQGHGTVVVRFMMDDTYNDGIPLAGDVTAVQDHLDDPARHPVTSLIYVVSPVASVVNMTIKLSPNTQAVQDAVTAELQDLFRREALPGGTIPISHIREAVSIAEGETDHQVVTPSADVVANAGEISVLGVITFQAL